MHTNTLQELIRKHQDWNWDWKSLTINPSITMEFIEEYMTRSWDWSNIWANPNMTPEFGRKYKKMLYGYFINPTALVKNPNIKPETFREFFGFELSKYNVYGNIYINLDFIREHPNWKWNWSYISRQDFLTHEFLENVPTKRLDMEELSANPCITAKFVEAHIDWKWDWYFLSGNPSMTEEFFERYAIKRIPLRSWTTRLGMSPFIRTEKLRWDMELLSGNPCITSSFVIRNFDWKWHRRTISSNSSVVPDLVDAFPGCRWDWSRMSKNKSITCEFIERHIHEKWNWGCRGLSYNPIVTPEFVSKHMSKPWNWRALSRNKSMCPHGVRDHPDWPWDWRYMSLNPSLTPEFVEEHADKPWDVEYLSKTLKGRDRVSDEFRKELIYEAANIEYRPGGRGYKYAKEEFMKCILVK